MRTFFLTTLVLCTCVLFAACGDDIPNRDIWEDALADASQLDAAADSGATDAREDVLPVDVTADVGTDATVDAGDVSFLDAVAEVYQDTFENRMDTFFEGIRLECRPVDLGCSSDDNCVDDGSCVARGCVFPAATENYEFSPDIYHVAAMTLPTDDTPTGFDLNGDGVPDNKLAWAIGIFPGGTLRFNSILSDFVRTGVFNLMVELRDMPENSCGALTMALHPATSDIDLDGLPDGDEFQIRQDGFRTDGLGPVAQLNSVAIDGNLLSSGPGVELPLKVPLTDGTVLTLPLEGFRVEMQVPSATPTSGYVPRALALGLAANAPDANAVIGGYIRLPRVVDEVNTQGKNCACAGVDPDQPIASFRIEGGQATAACDQAIDTGDCDWSADGRFCAALDAICLAVTMMATNLDVTSGLTENDNGDAIPDALSLALYMSVTPSTLFEPPLAPDFAAVGDTWRLSPDCDVLQDDGPTLIGVISNDHFLPNDIPEIVSVDVTGSDGTVTIANGTQVVYTPNAGFWGYDDFTYTIEDGAGNQSTAQVSMRVSPATWYDPNRGLNEFCSMYCRQYELCYPDEYPVLYADGNEQCLNDCTARFGYFWRDSLSECSYAQRRQELCRAALPCFRVPEFDEAMKVLADGGETEDYHCEDQVWARLDACGRCSGATWGTDCAPCPTSDINIPCDGSGVCNDGQWGDGTCACDDGYELDIDIWTCRTEDICYPNPCTMKNAIPESCYPTWDGDQNLTYACSCENNTFWDAATMTCFDWCDPNPCLDDPNSTGTCWAMSLEYYCECNENYQWDPVGKACTQSF